jgi:hypothetical protein
MARRRNPKEQSEKLDLTELAKLLDLPTQDDIMEDLSEAEMQVYADALGELRRERERDLEEGEELSPEDEEALEEEARTISEKEAAHNYRNYVHAVEAAAEKFFELHSLGVTSEKDDGVYIVEPMESWEKSADAIRETINGVGMFEFSDLDEFLESGPYTPKEAVLSHLHWMKDYAEVYGDPSPQRVFERAMR